MVERPHRPQMKIFPSLKDIVYLDCPVLDSVCLLLPKTNVARHVSVCLFSVHLYVSSTVHLSDSLCTFAKNFIWFLTVNWNLRIHSRAIAFEVKIANWISAWFKCGLTALNRLQWCTIFANIMDIQEKSIHLFSTRWWLCDTNELNDHRRQRRTSAYWLGDARGDARKWKTLQLLFNKLSSTT